MQEEQRGGSVTHCKKKKKQQKLIHKDTSPIFGPPMGVKAEIGPYDIRKLDTTATTKKESARS